MNHSSSPSSSSVCSSSSWVSSSSLNLSHEPTFKSCEEQRSQTHPEVFQDRGGRSVHPPELTGGAVTYKPSFRGKKIPTAFFNDLKIQFLKIYLFTQKSSQSFIFIFFHSTFISIESRGLVNERQTCF